MANAKVTLNGVTLIDLTPDTVEAKYVVSARTAHKADGTTIIGTIPWRFVVQETLLFFDKCSVNGQSLLPETGSVTGTTLVI